MKLKIPLQLRPPDTYDKQSSVTKAMGNRASAWVIVYDIRTDRILMLKRSRNSNNPDQWNFPGGGTDGQPEHIAAARELWEEAGIKAAPNALLHIVSLVEPKASDYYLHIVDGQPAVKLDFKESSKYKWMTIDEIKKKGKKLHNRTAAFFNHGIHVRLLQQLVHKNPPV